MESFSQASKELKEFAAFDLEGLTSTISKLFSLTLFEFEDLFRSGDLTGMEILVAQMIRKSLQGSIKEFEFLMDICLGTVE